MTSLGKFYWLPLNQKRKQDLFFGPDSDLWEGEEKLSGPGHHLRWCLLTQGKMCHSASAADSVDGGTPPLQALFWLRLVCKYRWKFGPEWHPNSHTVWSCWQQGDLLLRKIKKPIPLTTKNTSLQSNPEGNVHLLSPLCSPFSPPCYRKIFLKSKDEWLHNNT